MGYKHVYIGGTGRSGSNILKELLGKHPDVYAIPFEPRYVVDPNGLLDFYHSYHNWSPFNYHYHLQQLRNLLTRLTKRTLGDRFFLWLKKRKLLNPEWISPPAYYAWELETIYPGFSQRSKVLLDNLTDYSYSNYWCGTLGFQHQPISRFYAAERSVKIAQVLGDFIRANHYSVLKMENKKLYLDDSTFSVLHAQHLNKLLPEAKFIHIVRDPRDVVASYVKQSWCPKEVKQATRWYKSIISVCRQNLMHLPHGQYLEIRLEDLINNTNSILRIISNFLQIDFLTYEHSVLLDKHNSARWKVEFTEQEKVFVNKELSAEIDWFTNLSI